MPGGGRRENVCAVRFAFCVRGAVDAVLLFTDLVVRVDAGRSRRTDARAFREEHVLFGLPARTGLRSLCKFPPLYTFFSLSPLLGNLI